MGDINTKTQDDLNRIIEEVKKYLSDHGIRDSKNIVNIERYLELSSDQLNKLSADSCGEIAYNLSEYALYLQKEINKQSSIKKWADKSLDWIILPNINNYGDAYVKFEQKKISAIKENPVATELYIISIKAEQNLTAMTDLPYRIEKMSDRLAALQATRRKRYDN